MQKMTGGFRTSLWRRGFTLAEVIATAVIIVILALILIPILHGRVEDARLTAAKDELSQLSKVITLAHADTGIYFRLHDFDNGRIYNAANVDPLTQVPITDLDSGAAFNDSQRLALSKRWQGPYTQFNNSETIENLNTANLDLFTELGAGSVSGPIYASADEGGAKYPLDPWGSPYLFFVSEETQYDSATDSVTTLSKIPVLYSMGPNMVPGDKLTALNSEDYFPTDYYGKLQNGGIPIQGVLGTEGSDDIVWRF
jgi:prepilin-type N-terminal cleavage/methylation domain-containing protein